MTDGEDIEGIEIEGDGGGDGGPVWVCDCSDCGAALHIGDKAAVTGGNGDIDRQRQLCGDCAEGNDGLTPTEIQGRASFARRRKINRRA